MKKKLDVFNFFFSSAAVVILIGVIAKILEWPSQDLLITVGLSIEAVVFGLSSIRFIEVSKNEQAATEKTLTKMVDKLNPSQTNQNEPELEKKSEPTVLQKIQAENYSISKFEKLKMVNVSADFYFQSEWFMLSEDDYLSLQKLIVTLFGKNLPAKSEYLFLKNSPIQLPDYSFEELVLIKPTTVSHENISLLLKAFKLAKFQNFLSNLIMTESQDGITIRNRKKSELQVYYSKTSVVAKYIETHYAKKLVQAPLMPAIETLIPLRDNDLIRYLIDDIKIKDLGKLTDLIEQLKLASGELQLLLISKIGSIEFNTSTKKELNILAVLVKALLNLKDKTLASKTLNKALTLKIDPETSIELDDVIYFDGDLVYFGDQNEYSLHLDELFSAEDRGLISYFENVMELLTTTEIGDGDALRELFGLNTFNSKDDLYTKISRIIKIKQNGKPKGGQIAFNLLHKQYSS
jgi:hypothetical protein